MEKEFPSSADTSLEIPAMIEAITSSLDEHILNFDNLDKSGSESSSIMTTTTESDHRQSPESWSSTPSFQEYKNYQHQQQQWNYPPNYSPYHLHQYGYMTPSPYSNPYCAQSPSSDYPPNYIYSMRSQESDLQSSVYSFSATTSNQSNAEELQYSCNICLRSFKSSANLHRHFISKTHLKRVESKRQSAVKVSVTRVKKSKVTNRISSTDLSKMEKEFLRQLDDEIWTFLKIYEQEQNSKKEEVTTAPTPPLTPKFVANLQKIESCPLNGEVTEETEIPRTTSSSFDLKKSLPEAETSDFVDSSTISIQISSCPSNQQQIQSATKRLKVTISEEIQSPRSVTSSPAVLINEKGEKFEVVFSDDHLK